MIWWDRVSLDYHKQTGGRSDVGWIGRDGSPSNCRSFKHYKYVPLKPVMIDSIPMVAGIVFI